MRKISALLCSAACLGLGITVPVNAQVTLTGTSYTQDFNNIGSGLPTGWAVYTSASISSLGTSSTFTIGTTKWSDTTSGTAFRNIASDNGSTNDSPSTQAADSNRALGWRPLTSGTRDGAVTLELTNTTGLENFNLSVSLFTANDVSNIESYDLEYRVGTSGNFASVGTYLTATPFSSTTLTANSITLNAINNQSDSVFIRIRGTNINGVASGSLDTIGIDNFSLTYSAISSPVPEPSTYAALMGALALAGVMIVRHRKRIAA